VQFGRYELIRVVAKGGMGEIYLAQLPGPEGFSKPIAVKRIFSHLSEDDQYREMFIREAKTSARLSHPNIVQVIELGEHAGELFIAMEFVRGTDLAHIMEHLVERSEHLPPPLAGAIAFDILDALDYAHSNVDDEGRPAGVIHQDISPQNILISQDGFVKLCDFGVAKAARQTASQTGLIGGKLSYMAPEQARGMRPDARTDVYSLGVVLHETLTGQRVYSVADVGELLEQVQNPDITPLRVLAPDLSPALAGCVDKALSVEPVDRFQTAAAFRDSIEDYLLLVGAGTARSMLRSLARRVMAPVDMPAPSKRETEALVEDEPEASTGWSVLLGREALRAGIDFDTDPNGHEFDDDTVTTRETPSPFDGDTTVESVVEGGDALSLSERPTVSQRQRPATVSQKLETLGTYLRRERHSLLGLVGLLFVASVVLVFALASGDDPEGEPARPLSPTERALVAPTPPGPQPRPVVEEVDPPPRRKHSRPTKSAVERRQPRPGPMEKRPPRSVEPKAKSTKEKPDRIVQFGVLNLNASPWAYVSIDGKKVVKPTPLLNYKLPAGTHRIRLEAPGGHVETIEVEIRAGQTVNRVVRFGSE